MEFIVHLVCRNVTGGRRVTDDCQEVTISADQGHDPTPDVSTKSVSQSPSRQRSTRGIMDYSVGQRNPAKTDVNTS